MIWKRFLENYSFTPYLNNTWYPLGIGVENAKEMLESMDEDMNKLVLGLAESTHVFCFADEIVKNTPSLEPKDSFILDLPFEAVWFEGNRELLATIRAPRPEGKDNVDSDEVILDEHGQPYPKFTPMSFEVEGLWVGENEPEATPDSEDFSYFYAAYGKTTDGSFENMASHDGRFIAVGVITRKSVGLEMSVSRAVHELVSNLLAGMNSTKAIGTEKVSEKIRIGKGAERKQIKIKNIIHVISKKVRDTYLSESARRVDWSHRWEVRGHWRLLPGGIGKDKYGDYGVKGFTWVSPHSKGPEGKPVIKKIRFFRSQKSNMPGLRTDVLAQKDEAATG